MKNERRCDGCGEETQGKQLGKIREQYLCKKCRVLKKKEHREKTIEDAGIKEDLMKLKNKINKERGYGRKSYERSKERRNKEKDKTPPIPKGTTRGKIKTKSQSYLSIYEKQAIFRLLVQRGIDEVEAKERIRNLILSQKELRLKLRQENKSEEETKQEQQKLLEELWNT